LLVNIVGKEQGIHMRKITSLIHQQIMKMTQQYVGIVKEMGYVLMTIMIRVDVRLIGMRSICLSTRRNRNE